MDLYINIVQTSHQNENSDMKSSQQPLFRVLYNAAIYIGREYSESDSSSDSSSEDLPLDTRESDFNDFRSSVNESKDALQRSLRDGTIESNEEYLASLARARRLLSRMTPQKIKHQREKKRRRLCPQTSRGSLTFP